MPRIPWWKLQTEISNLRSSLAALPCGRFGIFLSAIKVADDLKTAEEVVSLKTMVDPGDGGTEAVETLESAVVQLCEAGDVTCLNGAPSEVCHVLPMPLILPDGDKSLFLQAGAEIDLLYRPNESCFDRFFLRVRALTQSGFDLTLFDEVQFVTGRQSRGLSWPGFSGISFPWSRSFSGK